ncbi:hypothetical protein NHX12_004552, partial [Muraenolepis orangiensis]
MPVRRKDAQRALVLLEEYRTKLNKTDDRQLKHSIQRVIDIFQSNLFQALIDIQEFYEVTLLDSQKCTDPARSWEPLPPVNLWDLSSLQSPTGTSETLPSISTSIERPPVVSCSPLWCPAVPPVVSCSALCPLWCPAVPPVVSCSPPGVSCSPPGVSCSPPVVSCSAPLGCPAAPPCGVLQRPPRPPVVSCSPLWCPAVPPVVSCSALWCPAAPPPPGVSCSPPGVSCSPPVVSCSAPLGCPAAPPCGVLQRPPVDSALLQEIFQALAQGGEASSRPVSTAGVRVEVEVKVGVGHWSRVIVLISTVIPAGEQERPGVKDWAEEYQNQKQPSGPVGHWGAWRPRLVAW